MILIAQLERVAQESLGPATMSATRALNLVLQTRVRRKELKRDATECIQATRQVIVLDAQVDYASVIHL